MTQPMARPIPPGLLGNQLLAPFLGALRHEPGVICIFGAAGGYTCAFQRALAAHLSLRYQRPIAVLLTDDQWFLNNGHGYPEISAADKFTNADDCLFLPPSIIILDEDMEAGKAIEAGFKLAKVGHIVILVVCADSVPNGFRHFLRAPHEECVKRLGVLQGLVHIDMSHLDIRHDDRSPWIYEFFGFTEAARAHLSGHPLANWQDSLHKMMLTGGAAPSLLRHKAAEQAWADGLIGDEAVRMLSRPSYRGDMPSEPRKPNTAQVRHAGPNRSASTVVSNASAAQKSMPAPRQAPVAEPPTHKTYLDKYLAPGERVIYQARLHKIIYLSGILWCCTIVGAIVGIPFLIGDYIRRRTTHFIVTNGRVVARIGAMQTFSIEMMADKIETVDVIQTFWGRFFNYGTIMLTGVGGTPEVFKMVSNPHEFRAAVQQSAQQSQARRFTPSRRGPNG
jgi:hypothetical protein